MIPPIRDAAPISLRRNFFSLRFSRGNAFSRWRGAKHFFVFVLLLSAFGTANFAAPSQQSQDANAKSSPTPAAQQNTNNAQPTPTANSQQAAPASQAGSQPQANPLKKAVDQKKVITEDDLTKPRKRISLSDLDGEEDNPTCNLSCEKQLREQMGYGPDREGEFQSLLTLTRHEIADDKDWNSRLQEALQAAGSYCDIQRQKEQILGKGNVPQYVRDNVNSQFGKKEQTFILQYRNASGYMKQQIETVQRYSPFRATVMEYQWSEATDRVCAGYALP
jgi:hypothetical protein